MKRLSDISCRSSRSVGAQRRRARPSINEVHPWDREMIIRIGSNTNIEKYPLSLHDIFTITTYPDSEVGIILNQGAYTMEQRRTNWPAWIALGVSLLALIFAFGSMAMSQKAASRMWTMTGWSNPPQVAPPGWSERGRPGQVVPPGHGRGDRGQVVPPGHGRGDRGQVVPPAWHDQGGWMHPGIGGHGFGMMGGRGWFSGLIGLIDGLLKLAALALLIWLGFQIFRQRRNQPPAANPPTAPQPPLTPAGHDPRME
jgi:hypothetical protein